MAASKKIKKDQTIVHPHYYCALASAYTVAAIPGAVPITNCSPGCADKQYFGMTFSNGFQGSGTASGGDLPSVNMSENDIVFGGAKKLDTELKAALKIVKGDLFVILNGCAAELIGEDVESVVKPYREKGYNVVYADVAGFKGNNLKGHEIVIRAIIDQFVGDYHGKRRKKLINLWFEAPYFNTNWRGDYAEMKRILEGAGFDVNVFFGPESAGISEWKTIPKAAFNLVVSPWLGLQTAEYLQEKYNQPFLHIPVIPIGEEATTAFIRKVVRFSGIDPARSENFIAKESRNYYYYLEHFSDFFAEYWFGLPSKFATVGDSAYNVALTKFLADQIGMLPVKQIITDNPPEGYRDGIRELYHHLSDGVDVDVEFIEDGYLAEKSLEKADFGTSKPLILGSSWESEIADKTGAILLEIGTPATEIVVLNRSFIGYHGALTLLENIYTRAVAA